MESDYSMDLNNKKLYAVGCYSAEDWEYIHEVLLKDGTLEDNIPNYSIECSDLKEHSATRAVYLLTDDEASELSNHPRVEYVHENYESYPEKYKAPPEELTADTIRNYRYSTASKQYRNWSDYGELSYVPTSEEINRSGYQLLRCTEKADPWYNGVQSGASQIFTDRVQYYGDGSDVDVIVGDEGCWFGHVEFNNSTGYGPTTYKGTNVLKSGFSASATTGTCDVLDLLLDGPYYLDPAWFEQDPSNRLTLRWDGTTVPVESYARAWWTNSTQRSVGFSTIGTVSSLTSFYTRSRCNGSKTARPTNGTYHGTQCCGNTFGRTQGWAFNSNKWFINAYGTYGSDIEQYFTIMKLFHLYKPTNSKYGTKDPTINSNSWGYRSTDFRYSGSWYYYRKGVSGLDGGIAAGVEYTSSTLPKFMYYVGIYGDGQRMKGEPLPNSYMSAGKEMIDAGVIFVVAAGNSNQKQVGPDHPDFNNYWSTISDSPLTGATHYEIGMEMYNTTNRRGFPQQLGKYTDPSTGKPVYPAINIGALDDGFNSSGKERKVSYSDMGEEIDCYAPGDGTLSADASGGALYQRPDSYSGALTSYDSKFTGTSSACPVATGLIATKLQHNRSWTWQDVRNWLRNTVGDANTNQFYTGVESTSANTSNWADVNSLEGGRPMVIWDALTGNEPLENPIPEGSVTFASGKGLIFRGVNIKFT